MTEAWGVGNIRKLSYLKSNEDMEISEVTPTITIVILSFLFCIFMFRKAGRKPPLPPGPRGLPVVGYLPYISGCSFLSKSRDLARQYGPIYKMQVGSKLWVVVTSPSIAKELTRDKDAIFANHVITVALSIFYRGGIDISFSPYGSYWRDLRKMFVHEMLGKSNVDANCDHRKAEVRKAIKHLSSNVGKPIDIGELLETTTLNVLMNMVWGRTLEADEQSKVGVQFRELFQKFVDLINRGNISDIFPLLARLDIEGVAKESKAVLQSIEAILESVINRSMKILEAKETGQGNDSEARTTRKDYMQYMLAAEREETGTRFSRTQIKTILMSFIMGGSDTTSLTDKWVMIELLRNREMMQKVQQELDNVVGLNNIVEESHLPKLKYLEAVVKEAIRLHPVVPVLLPRYPSQSTTLAGYTIPKHASVYVNVWAIHRDPELWENPSDFKPERFLNEPDKWDYMGNSFEYLPFGSGRRICAGISLVDRMVMHTTASLLHSFDWQEAESMEVDDANARLDHPVFVVPTKRLPKPDLYA